MQNLSPWGRGHVGSSWASKIYFASLLSHHRSQGSIISSNTGPTTTIETGATKIHTCAAWERIKLMRGKEVPLWKFTFPYPTHTLFAEHNYYRELGHNHTCHWSQWGDIYPIMENIGSINFHNLWGIILSTILATNNYYNTHCMAKIDSPLQRLSVLYNNIMVHVTIHELQI